MNDAAGELRVFATVKEAQSACADAVEELLLAALATHDATLALSGGSTPKPTYEKLAASTRIDWARVTVFFADERCVLPGDAESNFRLVQETLGSRVPAKIVRMQGETADHAAAAKAYAELLPPSIDVVMLGMGPDGHTASLFPGHSETLKAQERVLYVANSPKPPPERLTLGARAIETAGHLVMLAAGADKRAALTRARDKTTPIEEVPARLARRGTWFVDEAAAKEST